MYKTLSMNKRKAGQMKSLLISCIVSIIIVPICSYAASDTVQSFLDTRQRINKITEDYAKYDATLKDLEKKIDECNTISKDIHIMATQLLKSDDSDSYALIEIYSTMMPLLVTIYYYERELLYYVQVTDPEWRSMFFPHRIKRISTSKLILTQNLESITKTSTAISNKAALLAIDKVKKNIRSVLKILDQVSKLLEKGKAKENP
jgi:hypothetical protein